MRFFGVLFFLKNCEYRENLFLKLYLDGLKLETKLEKIE